MDGWIDDCEIVCVSKQAASEAAPRERASRHRPGPKCAPRYPLPAGPRSSEARELYAGTRASLPSCVCTVRFRSVETPGCGFKRFQARLCQPRGKLFRRFFDQFARPPGGRGRRPGPRSPPWYKLARGRGGGRFSDLLHDMLPIPTRSPRPLCACSRLV